MDPIAHLFLEREADIYYHFVERKLSRRKSGMKADLEVQLVQKKLKCFHGEDAECPVKITGAHSFGSLIKAGAVAYKLNRLVFCETTACFRNIFLSFDRGIWFRQGCSWCMELLARDVHATPQAAWISK